MEPLSSLYFQQLLSSSFHMTPACADPLSTVGSKKLHWARTLYLLTETGQVSRPPFGIEHLFTKHMLKQQVYECIHSTPNYKYMISFSSYSICVYVYTPTCVCVCVFIIFMLQIIIQVNHSKMYRWQLTSALMYDIPQDRAFLSRHSRPMYMSL